MSLKKYTVARINLVPVTFLSNGVVIFYLIIIFQDF